MAQRLPIVIGADRGWERITIPLHKFSSDWSGEWYFYLDNDAFILVLY